MANTGKLWLAWMAAVALTACASPTSRQPEQNRADVEITVAAAADLQFAFTDIAKLYETQTGNTVKLVFGSTGQLAQQVEGGAPYDLLAAADVGYMRGLNEKGLIVSDTIANYAQGRIVLAVNRRAGITATQLSNLTSPDIKRIAIANPEHAPYGLAAKQALESANVWDKIQAKLVLGENVRQTLQYAQTGDAEVAIVALSVADVPEITWTLLDDRLHAPLIQALGVIKDSKRAKEAADFAAFINGEKGRPVMRRYGFILPGEKPIVPPDVQK